MKKLFTILTIFFISVNVSVAQDAKKLLDEVTNKVKTYKNVQIDFRLTIQNLNKEINQESKGNVTIEGDKYALNMMGITKLFDGKKIYVIDPEEEEVTISSPSGQDADFTPAKMLTFFNSGFKYTWDITQNVKGRSIQYVKLTPTNAKDYRKEVLIGIDNQTKNIYNLIEVGKDGTKTTIIVNSFKTNQPISKNEFTFDASKYANYYINKLD
ncbi:outer membrane lipoprotein carrier protein LolA [Flavobacterium agricola]|uniref:Outer membrane lipoprotein carrier protein LolA n=1 Tax=Flavobacterium agricola TaxID=2870839 RepID=A0ABY6M4T6_9FLAO|nr:outer membrane lipoprotein carrier protein LolA [Flavobacterium agricola]UYW02243.1 outer membrane lipoprotein carrier protein LolA [Flavobacterium agricola]